ncbi:MAG TPA: Smr/MutS family protein [Polyangiaceae bacterium]|nr:Smr/MutS family protein [Polyangiaceae bacterium]
MDEKTLSDLEWNRLLAALAERCRGEAGRRLALALPFAGGPAGARVALAEAREAFAAEARGEPLPLYGLRDVAPALDRLRVGAVLAPGELRDVGALLASARVLRRFLSPRQKTTLPALAAACLTDPTLDEAEGALTEAFDADGLLADHASPRLRELRVEYRAVRARMVSRLEELMRQHAAVLQDAYWTEREGRYVLPVRADAHEKVHGIVHGTSGSGATLFVEPRAVVGLGNRLKVLEGAVRAEEDAIYARLTALVADQLPAVLGAAQALAHADLRDATARLARDLDLRFLEPGDEPALALRSARHPLLALGGVEVVPADLSVAGGRAVVVSGPNAGGKTVALKACGLVALMARAGLPVPCAEGSALGWFGRVLTDVGDDQSLRQNLSTFSAHVRNLAAILEGADGRALVLLDEVATGTDPREGEALAVALLGELCARGAAVVCTTHYEGLKALGAEGGPFVNASVGFDLATMTPTFRLVWGVPGPSSALAVARRFGVPEAVLARAQAALGEGRSDFERLVARLHGEQAALERARAEADDARARAEALAADLAAELARVKGRETKALDEEIEALRAEVRGARETLRGAQAALRARPADPGRLRDAARAVDAVAAKVALGGALDPGARAADDEAAPASAEDLRPGARVYVPRLRAEAEVVEALPSGKVRVAAGPLKLLVYANEVRRVRGAEGAAARAAAPARPAPRPSRDETCDVRGLPPDDAVRMAEQFLDRLVGGGKRAGLFVHGRGDASLRQALHSLLRESRRVESFRPGDKGEGGDSVTVARLRP